MSLNDQFEHGRIPLKPLAYANRDIAQCNEILIDYGVDGTYHIYITDSENPSIVIDITNKIIREILPNARINANQFQVLIEGILHPTSLQEILNFIYKRFTYAENPNGFNYTRDLSKLLDPLAKNVLLRNTDGTILLPVTLAENIYDRNGKTIQDRLDNISKFAVSTTSVYAETNNQTQFEFDYPFDDYSDFIEVRVGTVYIEPSRYNIEPIRDREGHYTKGTLCFITPGDSIELDRKIDLIFMYNSKISNEDLDKSGYLNGHNIVNTSIPTVKLEKLTDSYILNDSSAIPTAAALNKLYRDLLNNLIDENSNIIWCLDESITSSNMLTIHTDKEITDGTIVSVSTAGTKKSTFTVWINDEKYIVKLPDETLLTRGLPANKLLRFILSIKEHTEEDEETGEEVTIIDRVAYIISNGVGQYQVHRLVHTCLDQETKFSYKELEYNYGDIISVYRNGVRLFVDIDYNINTNLEEITLFVRTEEGERIVFESTST